jgi:hypothetical protein
VECDLLEPCDYGGWEMKKSGLLDTFRLELRMMMLESLWMEHAMLVPTSASSRDRKCLYTPWLVEGVRLLKKSIKKRP